VWAATFWRPALWQGDFWADAPGAPDPYIEPVLWPEHFWAHTIWHPNLWATEAGGAVQTIVANVAGVLATCAAGVAAVRGKARATVLGSSATGSIGAVDVPDRRVRRRIVVEAVIRAKVVP
jgi:hypothetical protein